MLEGSTEANTRYNQILIQKAIYKKELKTNHKPFVQNIFTKLFNGLNKKQERLICDYFKS